MAKKSTAEDADIEAAAYESIALRVKALNGFLDTEAKSHKDDTDGFAQLLSSNDRVNIRTVSTGAISLDAAIGGGIPYGRITEIYGPEGGGKTTVALTAARNCQDEGGIIGFIDAEHGLNRELCLNIGIDEDLFVVFQPNSGEAAIEKVEQMLDSGAFDNGMIIVDSVAAMTPKAALEADVETHGGMALHARLMSRFMSRVEARVGAHGTALVLINQVRVNLGAYGAPDTSTGGKAIKFYSSLRVEVRSSLGSTNQILKNGELVGQKVTATIRKNRISGPGRKAEFAIIFGQGIDAAASILDAALMSGVVTRPPKSSTFTVTTTGENIPVKGRDNIIAYLGSPEGQYLADMLTVQIRAVLDGELDLSALVEEESTLEADTESEPTSQAAFSDDDPYGLDLE